MELVADTFKRMGLSMATDKTEMVLLAGRRKIRSMSLRVDDVSYETKECLKYLGLWFGGNARFGEHVRRTAEKVGKVIGKLEGILPRASGLEYERRTMMVLAASSVLLYAAPVWQTELTYGGYAATLERANCLLALRVASAYRTAPTAAELALAKIPPEEDWGKYEGCAKTFIPGSVRGMNVNGRRVDICWRRCLPGTECSGGHTGVTLWECPEWEDYRAQVRGTGLALNQRTIGNEIVENKSKWSAFESLIEKILRAKIAKENERKKSGSQARSSLSHSLAVLPKPKHLTERTESRRFHRQHLEMPTVTSASRRSSFAASPSTTRRVAD
ncbi:uncharacterized protein [Euwallacea fornicatus]|uniref:uncharacterized protein n=1 Tax=Euwallacea fornicatus TaxID=995702 RepID=UPI0033900ED2